MDYRSIYFMEGVELLPLTYSVITLPRYKCVKIIFPIMILVSSIASIGDTYQVVKFSSKSYFLKYGPYYLITIFMALSETMWFVTYFIYRPYLELFKSKFYWSLQMANDRTRTQISMECKWLERISILIVIFVVVLNTVFIYSWMKDWGHYSAFTAIFDEKFPEFSFAFYGLFAVQGVLWSAAITTMPWFSIYAMSQVKYQLIILCDYIKNISKGHGKKDLKFLLNDFKYQHGIRERLTFCIRRHQEILCHHIFLKGIDQTLYINAIMIISGYLIGFFSIFALFSLNFPPLMSILALMTYTFTMMLISMAAQTYEDTSEYLANTIYNLNWFTWNNDNLKTLRIFHLNTATRIWRVPAISFITINNSFMKSVSQAMYSMANLLYTSTK